MGTPTLIILLAIAFIAVKNRQCHLPNSSINKCTDSSGVSKKDADGNTLYPFCNGFFGTYSCEPTSKVCNLTCGDTQEPRCDFVTRVGYCCGLDGTGCRADKDCCAGGCENNRCTGSGPQYACAKDGDKCDSSPLGCCHGCLPGTNVCGTASDKPVWKRVDNTICDSGFSMLTPTPIPPFKVSDTTFVPENVKTIEEFGDYIKKYCKKENGCSAFSVSESAVGKGSPLPDWKHGVSWECTTDKGTPALSPTPATGGKNYVYIRQE